MKIAQSSFVLDDFLDSACLRRLYCLLQSIQIIRSLELWIIDQLLRLEYNEKYELST